MAQIPLVQLIEAKVRSAFTGRIADPMLDKLVAPLYGVALRYSCPFPLLVDADSGRRHDFQTRILDEISIDYIDWCVQALQWPSIGRMSAANLFEALFIHNPAYRKLVVYPSYASGDMYGVGASMILDPTLQLRLVSDGKRDRIDRSNMVRAFLTAFVDPSRISAVRAPVDARAYVPRFDSNAPISGLRKAERDYLEWLSNDLWSTIRDGYPKYGTALVAVDLFFGTNYVASRFADPKGRMALRKQIRASWGVDYGRWPKNTAQVLADFLKAKGFRTSTGKFPKQQNVIVLWIRFTGKTGGAHVEYDTSFEGLRQLLNEACRRGNDWVILVGDKAKQSGAFPQQKLDRRQRKIADIIANSPIPAVDLTEFWTDPRWTQKFTKRTDQFKLFELLHYQNRVKHLGARSGNLESLALLGYTVRYFEDKYDDPSQALDKTRMELWHDSVGYERIQVDAVPTRSGKYLLAKQDNYPGWTYDKRVAVANNKRTRLKVKPVGVSEVRSRVFIQSRVIQTDVLEFDASAFEFPRDEIVKIFDINRKSTFRTISSHQEFIPEDVIEIPCFEKGFSLGDLAKIGAFLKPGL